MIHKLTRNDTATQIRAKLYEQDTGNVVNFQYGSCVLKFRKKGASTILSRLNAFDFGSNFAEGVAVFKFDVGTLSGEAGLYEGEIDVTYSDGRSETVFEVLEFILREEF